MEVSSVVPTLDELIERFKTNNARIHRTKAKQIYASIAAGIRDPDKNPLPTEMTQLACQAMVVLLCHVERLESNDKDSSVESSIERVVSLCTKPILD